MVQLFIISRNSPGSGADPWAGRQGDISFVLESGEHPGRMVVGTTWNATTGTWDRAPKSTPWDANPGLAPDGKPDFYILEIEGMTKAQLFALFASVASFPHNPHARKEHPTRLDRDGLPWQTGRAAGRFSVSMLPPGALSTLRATGRLKVSSTELRGLLQERVT